MRIRLAGIAAIGSGIADWDQAKRVLSGREIWNSEALSIPSTTILSANERRRVSRLVRLALGAAEAACETSEIAPDAVDCVFTSALGDGAVTHAVMAALRTPTRSVSPTHFHNSVHNAMAGYWSIGAGNHQASTSLAGGQGSFGAALLKATLSITQTGRPVLLVAADHPFQPPLSVTRPVEGAFAVGMVLQPDTQAAAGPVLHLTGGIDGPASPPELADLHELWRTCPAARSLPLLEGLIEPRAVVLEAGSGYFLGVETRA